MKRDIPISRPLFYLLLAVEVGVIFLLNSHHANQQVIFEHRYLQLAHQIASFEFPVEYPMWGYPALLSLVGSLMNPALGILIVQCVLCILSVWLFYRFTALIPKVSHLVWLLPFIIFMSVKWPDAIIGLLLLLFCYYFKRYLEKPNTRTAIYCGIIQGVILNIRSEYLYISLAVILLYPAFRHHYSFSKIFSFCILSSAVSFLLLLPWALHSYNTGGSFRLGSSNSGLVLFTTLGQLPNNSWHIQPTDSFGEEYVAKNHLSDAYSDAGDSLLKQGFVDSIRARPIEFGKKVGYNAASIFFRGLYTGEYSRIAEQGESRDSIETAILSSGASSKLSVLSAQPFTFIVLYGLEKIFQLVFILILNYCLFLIIRAGWKGVWKQYPALFLPVLSLLVYKICLIGFIQYEPRHMSVIYLPLLAAALLSLRATKKSLSSENI